MNDCPIETVYADVNIANHLVAIKYANLGPADPRESSTEYWKAKEELWLVPEGVARTRLCMNCAHYDNSKESLQCIADGAGGQIKPSELPVTPKWANIEGMPAAVCTMWNITCSALRTCDTWEDASTDPDNANVDFDGMQEGSEKSEINLTPTAGMAAEARKALDWRAEGHRGGTQVGLVRANQLVKRQNLSKSTVLRMYSFFSRHEVDKQATGFHSGEEGYPSPGRVAWGLWGGDAGYTWSKSKRDLLMKE